MVAIAAYAAPTQSFTTQTEVSAPVRTEQTTLQKVLNHDATIPAAVVVTAATGALVYHRIEKRRLVNEFVESLKLIFKRARRSLDPAQEAALRKASANLPNKELRKSNEDWAQISEPSKAMIKAVSSMISFYPNV